MIANSNARLVRVLGVIGATLLIAAACSSGASPSPSSTTTPTSPGPYASAPSATASTPPASPSGATGETYTVGVATGGSVGSFLTGEDGKTLYTFKPDGTNSSSCSGACASTWPAFTVEADDTLAQGTGVTGALTTFARADGTTQVSYNGHPLYYFSGDAKAGDTNGQGILGKWFVAAP